MPVTAIRQDANELMFQGALALSKVQSNGMRIDVPYCLEAKKELKENIESLTSDIIKMPEVKKWKRLYRDSFNLGSDDQLADILFNHLGYTSKKETKSGKPSVDVMALEEIIEETGSEMLKGIMRLRKMEKAYTTYLGGILREVNDDGFLRPFFHLHKARTYRSSSSAINFQNIPTRDKDVKKLIRSAFLPRNGRQILEVDFKGVEVSVACCYHKDPTMEAYLRDPTKDMHRDMCKQLYILNDDEWNKPCRQGAKNKFVFPEFYGSYYMQVAPDLWKYAILNKLRIGKEADGPTVIDHLKSKGIKNLDKFIKHVKKIEDHFWGERFPVYTEWKENHWSSYQKKGYFDSLTGFRYHGIFKRNEVINYPVQGSAFHCLLWTLIQLQNWLEENDMQTLIIGQIHDSMVIDMHPKEKDDVLGYCQHIVKKMLPKHFKWIHIPMTIEAELAGIDEPWLNKKEISLSMYF